MKIIFFLCFSVVLNIIFVQSSHSINDDLIQTIIVRAHNQLRREVQPPASNMKELEWSKPLQLLADYKIQDCQISSLSLNYNGLSYGYTSRTILDVNKPNLTLFLTTVEDWFDSSKFYDMYDNECRQNPRICENFIQAAWANSSEIGCAYKYCSFPAYETTEYGILILCLYYSGMDGDLPYIPGQKCSLCPSSYPFCNHGLCSKASTTESPSVIPFTSATNINGPMTDLIILLMLFISLVLI